MDVAFDLVSVISMAGIGTGLTMAVLLITLPNGNGKANIWLALFVAGTSYSIFTAAFSIYTGLYRYIPHTIGTSYFALMLLGPLLYQYFKTLYNHDRRITPLSLLHLLPQPIFLIAFHRLYLSTATYKIAYLCRWANNETLPGDRQTGYLLPVPFLIQAPIYLLAIALMIRKYHKKAPEVISDQYKRRDRWVRQVLWLSLIPTAAMMFLLVLTTLDHLTPSQAFRIIPMIITVFLVILSLSALLQPSLFKSKLPQKKTFTDLTERERSNPYSSRYLEERDFQKVVELMKTTKIYRNPDLTLPFLADNLGIKRCNLSWLINNRTGKNFYDFINGYRLEEVLQEMERNPDGILLDKVHAAGFCAKSTFYKYFKAATGKTPREMY
jgi:AraC-like DNA-binding protein